MPRNPPPGFPVRTFPSPKITDQVLVEWVNVESGSYTPIEPGTPHPNQREFSGFRLGVQRQSPQDHNFIQRIWVTDETDQTTYNYALKFLADSITAPIFIRTYRESKTTYEPHARGSALGSIYKLILDDPGSGYAYGALPTVIFGNPPADPTAIAVAHGIVNPDGTIGECILDFNGEGYTDNVGFTVELPISGNPASGTAFIQPVSAVLVKEEANLFPQDSEFYADYFQVTRVYETLPGPFITTTRVDDDGKTVTVKRRHNLQSAIDAITLREYISSGVWYRISSEPVEESYFVAWEVQESRPLPGNAIPSSIVDRDHEIANMTKILKDQGTITPAASEAGGFITTVEKKEVSDLVSDQITTVKQWLDAAGYHVAIPEGIIPEEFRAEIPFVTESHIKAGTASMPTLAAQEFEHSKKQLTKLLYEETIVSLGNISLPQVMTSYLMTEMNGGGILKIVRTLSAADLGADSGYLVVASKDTPLGNGMWFKETRSLFTDLAWPELVGTHVDERYKIAIGIKKKVVPAGTTGGVDVDGTIRQVNVHDKWRSIQIASKIDLTSLPAPVTWFSGQRHSFPPELITAQILWAEAVCGCSSSFSAVLEANMKQYSGFVKTRITEQFYGSTPPDDVTITQFFPQSHNFGFAWWSFCGDSDGNCRTKSGAPLFHIPLCLHDDLSLSVGISYTWSFAATTPATLPHGGYIMLPPHVERWRFGVFRRVLTEVLVP